MEPPNNSQKSKIPLAIIINDFITWQISLKNGMILRVNLVLFPSSYTVFHNNNHHFQEGMKEFKTAGRGIQVAKLDRLSLRMISISSAR